MRPPYPALASLLCAALATGCMHLPPRHVAPAHVAKRPPRPQPIRYQQTGWLITARPDPFTGETTCRLANHMDFYPNATVARGAIAFHFAHRVDASDAWYRIDGGPPHAWRDLIPRLIDEGAMSEAERLDNPTDGVVLIPRGELTDARTVVIRPAKGQKPQMFDLRGVWPLLIQAKRLGCPFG